MFAPQKTVQIEPDVAHDGPAGRARHSLNPPKGQEPVNMAEHKAVVDILIASQINQEVDPYLEDGDAEAEEKTQAVWDNVQKHLPLEFDGNPQDIPRKKFPSWQPQPQNFNIEGKHNDPFFLPVQPNQRDASPPEVFDEADDMPMNDGPDDQEEAAAEEETIKQQRPLLELANPDGSERLNRMMIGVVTGGKKESVKTNRQAVLETWFDGDCYMVTHEEVETDRVMWLSDVAESGGHRGLPEKVKAMFAYMYKHHIDDYEWFIKADDDTYIHKERLRKTLSVFDPTIPMILGKPYATKCSGVDGPGPLWRDFVTVTFCHGGAGWVVCLQPRSAVVGVYDTALRPPRPCPTEHFVRNAFMHESTSRVICAREWISLAASPMLPKHLSPISTAMVPPPTTKHRYIMSQELLRRVGPTIEESGHVTSLEDAAIASAAYEATGVSSILYAC